MDLKGDKEFHSSLDTIFRLYNENKDNKLILSKINQFLNQEFPLTINKWKFEYESNIQTKINMYIEKFSYQSYYYINNSNIFIYYDDIDYKIIKEDEIWHNILSNTSEDDTLFEHKINIKDMIIDKIKSNSITNCLPESTTIQTIINYLHPLFFSTKEEAKYFCCIIGDHLFNKKIDSIYFNKLSKNFIDKIKYLYEQYFGYINNKGTSLMFIHATHSINPLVLTNYKILHFKKNIVNDNVWKQFLTDNFFNLMAVSIHYSKQYENSNQYILNRSDYKLKNRILYLNNNNLNDIMTEFKSTMSKKQGYKIELEDVFYLWKKFLETKHIYCDILNNSTKKIINDNFHNTDLYHNQLSYISKFKLYIENDTVAVDDELEISELTNLFNDTLNENQYVHEDEILSLVRFYYDFNIKGKSILNIQSKHWNKINELKRCISDKFSVNIEVDITFMQLYKHYCKYCKNNELSNIASKQYFEKYLVKFIPRKYIMYKKVSSQFWK
tara:strand:+ start:3112 stop:4605 length:1494 start_codon:yes stop_codon:yes gene_type:complete